MTANQYVTHPVATTTVLVVGAALLGAVGGYGAAYVGLRPAADSVAPVTRDVYLFSVVLPFDDEAVGLPHDAFSPTSIIAHKGDTIRVHFANTEDEPEDHTFVMDPPYAMKYTAHQGDKVDISFVASTAGTFAYYCDLHKPTMAGTLVVLG